MNHFDAWEFDCKCPLNCGCTGHDMDEHFLAMLDNARGLAGCAFIITSGVRCEPWNVNQGGSDTSSHLVGLAADIACGGSGTRALMLDALRTAGFNRIGIAKDFIHVDCDPGKPAHMVWVY